VSNLFRIHPDDTVAVELSTGMKYALKPMKAGDKVVKYGYAIGVATKDIALNEQVHTQNLASALRGEIDYGAVRIHQKKAESIKSGRTFDGFTRKNGKVGIRNELFIIPTVGCVNGLCRRIQKAIGDGRIRVFEHNYGCSQLGDDHENTRLILKNLALHPNAGGVLIVALGCENNSLEGFQALLADCDPERIQFLRAQDEGDELAAGIQKAAGLLARMDGDIRTKVGIENLVIGLKCGGSDGLSGITANPLLGRISETLTACGASVLMTEVPEMFGAEHILMQNAKDKTVKKKIEKLITDFKAYYTAQGMRIDENPSPGNKAGGITTLAEKSLGCIQKGGGCTVTDVLDYTQTIREKGLSLLKGPGNDMVAVTALAAAGAHMILFTTGRGTPLGAAVPVYKISTNTTLYEKKPNWIDFDAGQLVGKNADKEKIETSLLEFILKTADGATTKAEQNGFVDFAVWKSGVTL
jgi:altronate hydrolase